MSELRKAAQELADALGSVLYSPTEEAWVRTLAAHDALRAALAQPDPTETWQDRANTGAVSLPPKAAALVQAMPDDFFGLILEVMDEAAVLTHPDPASLDAAWARVEAALPEGWELEGINRTLGGGWIADVMPPQRPDIKGNGPTPAAALNALAEKLEGM